MNENHQQSAINSTLPKLKLDSIRSVATIIVNRSGDLIDKRSNIHAGTYQKDTNQTLLHLRFFIEPLFIDEINYPLHIDMINMERWDSTKQTTLSVDSAFYLTDVSHLALANITVGDVTNEVQIPVRMKPDSFSTLVEGKVTLSLKNWGFDAPEVDLVHLGLALYTLSEN